MTVSGISGYLSTDPTTASNIKRAETPQDQQNMFLQLLVQQLKYQDPMNPTDTSQMLAQEAQFQALSAMTSVQTNTQQLLAAQQAFGATSMIGKTVSFYDADNNPVSATVNKVTFGSTGPVVTAGGYDVPLNNVVTVSDPSVA